MKIWLLAIPFPLLSLIFFCFYTHAEEDSRWENLAGSLTAGFIEFSIVFIFVELALRFRENMERNAKESFALSTLKKPINDLANFVFAATRATASAPGNSGKTPVTNLFSTKAADQISRLQMDSVSNFSLGRVQLTLEGKLEAPPLLSWQDYITYSTQTWLSALDVFISRYAAIVSAEIILVCEQIYNHPFHKQMQVHNSSRNMLPPGLSITGDLSWARNNIPDDEKLSNYFGKIQELIVYIEKSAKNNDLWLEANWSADSLPKIGSGLKASI